ncbi:MAG: ABC-type transport auxiliary lipoprotein family protein [Gammaproteobacteria bacterium]
MRKYTLAATLCILAPVTLIAGCGLLSQGDTTPVEQYEIAPAVSMSNPPAMPCKLVVRVRNVEASTPWATDNMLYTKSEHAIASFAYHRWAATPATMLTDTLVKALAANGLYRGVLGPVSPGNADLTLAVTLRSGPVQTFSGQTDAKGGNAGESTESLTLAANLTRTQSGELVASKTFDGSEAATADPYGGVTAANALAGKLLGEMLDWLAQTNATLACGGG